jgi:hypothetical protein
MIYFPTYPRASFINEDYTNIESFFKSLINLTAPQLAAANLAPHALAYIKHYGTFLIVCPHNSMRRSILRLRDNNNSITINNQNVLITEFDSSFFDRCVVVTSPKFDMTSQNVIDSLRHGSDHEYDFQDWQTLGSIYGRQIINGYGRLYEYYIPENDINHLREQTINSQVIFSPVINEIECTFTVRFANNRFENFVFTIDLPTASKIAQELNLEYNPYNGLRATQIDIRPGENQHAGRERGRPNFRQPRTRSSVQEYRSNSRNHRQ